MFILGLIGWWIVGMSSFIYWWTKDYDLDINAAGGALIIGVAGPIAFFIGWLVHGDTDKVLIKKRGS